MTKPTETEGRLRAGLDELADAVVAQPETIAIGAEFRAKELARRRRRQGGLAVVCVVVLAIGCVLPIWMVSRHREAAPAADLTAEARCQGLVDGPDSDYSRVVAAAATTGAGLREWLGRPGVGDDAWQREAAHLDPAAQYVVCGFMAPHVVVSQDPDRPIYNGIWAVIEVLPPTGPAFGNVTSTPRNIRLEVDAIPPAGAEQRCTALVDVPHSPYSGLLISRAVTGAQLRHWLITRDGGVYSPDVVRRYDPDWHYAVCALVEPDAAPPGPVPPKGTQAVILVLPPSGKPVLDAMARPGEILDLVAQLR